MVLLGRLCTMQLTGNINMPIKEIVKNDDLGCWQIAYKIPPLVYKAASTQPQILPTHPQMDTCAPG